MGSSWYNARFYWISPQNIKINTLPFTFSAIVSTSLFYVFDFHARVKGLIVLWSWSGLVQQLIWYYLTLCLLGVLSQIKACLPKAWRAWKAWFVFMSETSYICFQLLEIFAMRLGKFLISTQKATCRRIVGDILDVFSRIRLIRNICQIRH